MKIAVLPNLNKRDAHKYTVRIIKKLLESDAEVLMFSKYEGYFNFDKIKFYEDFFDMVKKCDIVTVVGGDGSIIHASKHAAAAQKPILGVNLGRVGFVAGLEVHELDRLDDLLKGDYKIEKRMMLEVNVKSNDEEQKIFALNDVVISRNALSRIIELSVKCNDKQILDYRSDGIIVSTPTGSTAYSLSAGGPVIEPCMKCILVTPICSHSLFSRSIVFSDSSELSISLPQCDKDPEPEVFLSADGETCIRLSGDSVVDIKVSDMQVSMVKLKDKDFYEILNEKLSDRNMNNS